MVFTCFFIECRFLTPYLIVCQRCFSFDIREYTKLRIWVLVNVLPSVIIEKKGCT